MHHRHGDSDTCPPGSKTTTLSESAVTDPIIPSAAQESTTKFSAFAMCTSSLAFVRNGLVISGPFAHDHSDKYVEQILQNNHIMLTAREVKHSLGYISVLHRISGFPICRSEAVSRNPLFLWHPEG